MSEAASLGILAVFLLAGFSMAADVVQNRLAPWQRWIVAALVFAQMADAGGDFALMVFP